MFRTPIIAAMTVALLGGTALAQPASSPPANLSNSARSAPDYDDENGPPPGYQNGPPPGYQGGPPPGYQNGPQQGPPPSAQQAQADRDMFCRRDAAARTGYVTPDQAGFMNRPTAPSAVPWAAPHLARFWVLRPAMPVWVRRLARARA